ncbi:MAG: redoxin domain-containing protein [Terriglobia bacterium]
MHRLESSALIILAILPLTLPSGASQTPSAMASGTMVRDIEGHRISLFGQDVKAAVLFFITNDCPITNSYIPEINRIVANYKARKTAFYAVYTDPTVSIPAIRRHALEFGLHIPLIPDTAHYLVHRVGATVTPEVAVLERGGKLVYLGPIDDLYVDFGKRRAAPTQWYLRQALDAVLSGKPVAIPAVNPIGCFISEEP